jgi:hypothetical protein
MANSNPLDRHWTEGGHSTSAPKENIFGDYDTATNGVPDDKVDPEMCAKCGFKGTILCTHRTGRYRPDNETVLVIPDYDPVTPVPYPGDIKPGSYNECQLNGLIRDNLTNPPALKFIADMLEK